MAAVFIAGTGTDIGKTYVTAALIRALRKAGRPAVALKPVASGFEEGAPAGSDPAVLLEAMGRPVTSETIAAITPWRYRAPLAPDQAARLEGRSVDGAAVIGFCQEEIAAAGEALVFVESAGGIMSPLDETRTMLDLGRALAAPGVLVTGAYIGAISHTLTAVQVIAAAGLSVLAVVVNGAAGPLDLADTTAAIQARLPDVKVIALANGEDGAVLLDRIGL